MNQATMGVCFPFLVSSMLFGIGVTDMNRAKIIQFRRGTPSGVRGCLHRQMNQLHYSLFPTQGAFLTYIQCFGIISLNLE